MTTATALALGLCACADVTSTEAQRLVENGAVLVDVRSPEEFRDGHLPGARNVPIDNLKREMARLPRRRPLVVYCHTGARAFIAAGWLRDAGYDVRLLGSMNHYFGTSVTI